MKDHVYKTLEITGSSEESIEHAVRGAISRAQESVHNLRWFEVDNIRGHIHDGEIGHWQVTIKLGITLDPAQ
jgi:flavin-binding protein dodecin